jgi:hypothetical protein
MTIPSQVSKRVRLEANRDTGGGNMKAGLLSSTGHVTPLLNFAKRRTAFKQPVIVTSQAQDEP